METALDIFRLVMREQIAPDLRRMGFKGSDQLFTLPSKTHWVQLGFQKSMASNAKAVRFTVNLTTASKRAWVEARREHSYLGERPGANISYGDLAWQRRIGQLLPDGRDKWWTVTTRASVGSVRVEVLDAIRTYALPAIERSWSSTVARADSGRDVRSRKVTGVKRPAPRAEADNPHVVFVVARRASSGA